MSDFDKQTDELMADTLRRGGARRFSETVLAGDGRHLPAWKLVRRLVAITSDLLASCEAFEAGQSDAPLLIRAAIVKTMAAKVVTGQ